MHLFFCHYMPPDQLLSNIKVFHNYQLDRHHYLSDFYLKGSQRKPDTLHHAQQPFFLYRLKSLALLMRQLYYYA